MHLMTRNNVSTRQPETKGTHGYRDRMNIATKGSRNERGSAVVEAAIGVPAFLLFVLLLVAGGRIAIAEQAVQASASEAARAASISRTQRQAQTAVPPTRQPVSPTRGCAAPASRFPSTRAGSRRRSARRPRPPRP